ncbi:MAG: DUF6318 family protein [Actinomycetaceae bacterium]|nr:DUF6318 family protein [Actinomycetaceae bacterium]
MKRSPRLIGALAVLSLSATTLAACGETGAAEPTSPPTTVATTQVTEEPTTVKPTVPPNDVLYPHPVPEMPPEAYEHSVLGAQAFTVYFLETYAYAMSIRDAQPLKDIMLPESEFLIAVTDNIDWLNETDSYYLGYHFNDMVVNGTLQGGQHPEAEFGTQVTINIPEYTYVDGESGVQDVVPAERYLGAAEVVWRDGWVVSQGDFVEYSEVYNE